MHPSEAKREDRRDRLEFSRTRIAASLPTRKDTSTLWLDLLGRDVAHNSSSLSLGMLQVSGTDSFSISESLWKRPALPHHLTRKHNDQLSSGSQEFSN